ncbi:MAG: D-alanyl-D-alanine carboxypeptidase [Mucilaginibacter polytrichastri]|nr:D-alanyl-D-alanine carboxypeptidase [Mucilaginibacter polytrichastri]
MKKGFTLLFVVCFFCCSSSSAQVRRGKVKRMIRQSAIVQDHFTGFALYDLAKEKMVYEQFGDKYFTPASNTKLFTFYACMHMLGDSIPGLRYVTRGDTLIFWGTGDPTFLHPDFEKQPVYDFLKSWKGPLVYASGNYEGNFYGRGWQYDDYNDYYQPEKSELPVYGNIVRVKESGGKLLLNPAFFSGVFFADSTHTGDFYIRRKLEENRFDVTPGEVPAKFGQDIPFKTAPFLTATLLKDTLKRNIRVIRMTPPAYAKTLYSMPSDTVYRHMLQPSDNFMAEQLLLLCGTEKLHRMNADSVIAYAKRTLLSDLPDEPQWADGSGLSHQDLFTPRSIIALLRKIYAERKDEALLFSLMPEGGRSGTLRNVYRSESKPFVFAKTGSLSNVHNQSGYLVTKKGRRLIFSFMNNQYVRPTKEIRDEMVRIMTRIHNEF